MSVYKISIGYFIEDCEQHPSKQKYGFHDHNLLINAFQLKVYIYSVNLVHTCNLSIPEVKEYINKTYLRRGHTEFV